MKNYFYELYNYIFRLFSYLGCHQFSHRSFFIKNYQFPLCSRCIGIIIGFFLAIILKKYLYYTMNISLFYCNFLIMPMLIDWTLQYILKQESKNWIRFITGIFGGFGELFLLNNIFKL